MPYLDMPPAQVERVVCSITAAIKYQVPANIMLAIAEKEGGSTGLENKNRNANGTYDVGRMQFNTVYLKDLEKYGITADDVAQPGCYSYDLAAWRIRGHIKNDKGDIWTKSANYHSKTPEFNTIYRADLIRKAAKWQKWIEARFNTFDATKPASNPVQSLLAAAKETPEKEAGQHINQITELATDDKHLGSATPPRNDGKAAMPSTPDQLMGFTASVQDIPVKTVSRSDYRQTTQPLPSQFNKGAAAALAAVYGNNKLR